MDVIRRATNQVLQINIGRAAYWQFVRFSISGAVCAFLEFYLLVLLVETYGEAFTYVANAFAFSLAVVINYLLSRYWVFERGKYSTRLEFIAFCITAAIALGLNSLVMWIALESFLLPLIVSKILAILIVVAWNFTTKNILFSKPEPGLSVKNY
ncbi:MAG: GtrA family protein [Bacteroidia bacterium]|nr:GtrA family protein [Bacteroidia bacterium]